ncbi:TIGR02302 family protein [Brucella gallinifaecis]|uniref:TIGR02302 family protein n=1 Tax=Brucella gallinifaecis TaxID=215590 RepID=A0A502BL56_9HYPH|nr:TIGR02302 family protein [Brucella gallinifaecis]TPF74784.1 TIGR02302 family protein [Brucella gallinifaecis]
MTQQRKDSKDLPNRKRDAFFKLFSGEDAALRRLRLQSFLTLSFERLWPLILPLILLIALFASLSWLGLFALMPRWLHIAVLGLFGLAGIIALYLPFRFKRPDENAITTRIEDVNGLIHEPLAVQSWEMATGNNDPFALALWHEHKRRMAERLKNLQSGIPRPHIPERDPLALRAIVALLFVTAAAFSISPNSGHISDAFNIRTGSPSSVTRIDAWVTPPQYTGRAPIFLSTTLDEANVEKPITVPQGSIVNIRIIGGGSERLTTTDSTGHRSEIKPVLPKEDETQGTLADKSRSFRYDLQQDQTLTLSGINMRWTFAVTPDNPPSIHFTKEPGHALNGTLQLAYEISDDYGAIKAYGEIVPLDIDHEDEETAPLYDAPDLPLALPRRGTKEASTSKDLTQHPWAGQKVALTLVATDAAGKFGRSETKIITLPERPFSNPLAKAVAEQRRILALDATQRDHVRDMLSALMIRPEETIKDKAHYLGLVTIRTRLRLATGDDALRDTADYMWQVALGIEDGNLSAAEKRLRQAQEALRNALQNGASQEEIEKLTAQLREAMQQFLHEFAQRQQQNPNARNQPMDPNTRMLTDKDLARMMDQIENLARQGSRDQAEQLLSQLQDMMNNLQMGQQSQAGQQGQGQGQASPMQQQMNKLGDLMRRQQQMMNETFKLDQQMQQQLYGNGLFGDEDMLPGDDGTIAQGESQQGGQSGETSSEMAEAMRRLQQQQQALQQELKKFGEDLKDMGIDPNKDFSEAGKSMGNAADALGRSESTEAGDQQGNALEALRRGGRDMMQQMQQAMGQDGQGQSGQQGQNGRDPLGRQQGSNGMSIDNGVKVPGEIDIQRAREILDAIRRKLGDALTPQMEKEYLQRLLQFD